MFYKKQGFPESGDIVICTVKRILHNSVFVELDEYIKKEGIIHISEISPGRIRTVREFVKEGKKIVCKVLRINEIHNSIELSLRRVNMSLKIKKNEEYKLEQKAEKILEKVAEDLKANLQDIYKRAGQTIINEYGSLNSCFIEIVKDGEKILTKLGIEKKLASALTSIIQQRIKIPEIKVSKIVLIKDSSSNGIQAVKDAFKKIEDYAKTKDLKISTTYLGSPRFSIALTSSDYKKANADMENLLKTLTSEVEKSGGTAEIINEK